MFRALLLTISLLATSAAAQTASPVNTARIDDAVEAFTANTTIWPRDWFLLGDGVGLTGETRMRASDRAGICEQDYFEFGTGPEHAPGIPRATQIHVKTSYGIMAIEKEADDRSSEDEIAQDIACFRWSQSDGNMSYVVGEDADMVWIAGQAFQALALDARSDQRTSWGCADIEKCPTRVQAQDILTIPNFVAVQETHIGCDNILRCLLLEFSDGDKGLWLVAIQPDCDDGCRSAKAIWSWTPDVVVD
jgi:hypothetical protein